MVNGRALIFHMRIRYGKTFGAKVIHKVHQYQGYILKKKPVVGVLVFHKHILVLFVNVLHVQGPV